MLVVNFQTLNCNLLVHPIIYYALQKNLVSVYEFTDSTENIPIKTLNQIIDGSRQSTWFNLERDYVIQLISQLTKLTFSLDLNYKTLISKLKQTKNTKIVKIAQFKLKFKPVYDYPLLYHVTADDNGQTLIVISDKEPPFYTVYPGPFGFIYDPLITTELNDDNLKFMYSNFLLYTASLTELEFLKTVKKGTIQRIRKLESDNAISKAKALISLRRTSDYDQR